MPFEKHKSRADTVGRARASGASGQHAPEIAEAIKETDIKASEETDMTAENKAGAPRSQDTSERRGNGGEGKEGGQGGGNAGEGREGGQGGGAAAQGGP